MVTSILKYIVYMYSPLIFTHRIQSLKEIIFFFLNNCSGTMIPRSGGDYAYIGVAFGPLPAFLYLWVALLILVPTGNAITALTFAQYLLQPFWPACDEKPPIEAVRLIAAIITCKFCIP